MQNKPELISFDLCPFVQRSVITLLEKSVPFEITYIDLANPPVWFSSISPLGKVPVLKINGTSLFESAVINEYLDEITPPSLHPADPLQKAQNRAWIEFASELLGSQYLLSIAKDEDEFTLKLHDINKKLHQLEPVVVGPYFNGEKFSLVDAAFAPAFWRFDILEQQDRMDLYQNCPNIDTWAKTLLSTDSVKASVTPDFRNKYLKYIENTGGYSASIFGRT